MSSKDFVFVIIGVEARTKWVHSASIVNNYCLLNSFAMKEDHDSLGRNLQYNLNPLKVNKYVLEAQYLRASLQAKEEDQPLRGF